MIRLVLLAVTLAAFPPDSSRGEETVHLTVRPMSAPKPALKFQLLPEVRELNPGNAAQNYLKCFMEQRYFFFTKESAADRARYQTMPLAELPTETLSNYGGGALRQADWAARLDSLDWQTSDRIQTGGMEVLPAELGPLQLLAAALHVRFRGEVAAQSLRRRDPDRQDDARAGPSPGRASHGARQPDRPVDRAPGPRQPRRDGAAAGVPQPLLGADRPALPPGGPAQRRAGRPHHRGGGAAAAPRSRPHDGCRARDVREPPVRPDELRTRTGGPASPQPAGSARVASQGPGADRSRSPTPGRGRLRSGSGREIPALAGHPAGREARLRDRSRRSDEAPGPAPLADRFPGRPREKASDGE